jgi:hypothetical protein
MPIQYRRLQSCCPLREGIPKSKLANCITHANTPPQVGE